MPYKYSRIAESQVDDPRNKIESGTLTVHLGKDTDPDYTVLCEEGIIEITHEIVEEYEAPEMMSEDELLEWTKEQYFGSDTGGNEDE